jgi:hypothetical protein
MKKTFPLAIEGKHPERLLEATKHEIRKYIQRERRRALPEGVDYWDFDCKFGLTEDSAADVHIAQITALIDGAAKAQLPQFYIAILAKAGHRTATMKTGLSDAQNTKNLPPQTVGDFVDNRVQKT